MCWGSAARFSKPLKELRMATFNARAETVETKPVFRDAFKRTRCLIPMSGYYEWPNVPSGKQPCISRRVVARRSLPQSGSGTNGKTARLANAQVGVEAQARAGRNGKQKTSGRRSSNTLTIRFGSL
jgi:hypothetical protein